MHIDNHTKAFTLVETLVAISVLLIGIVAPMTAINSALNASRIAEDRIFAYYLAQEAVEYVRYARDTNIVSEETSWIHNLDNCLRSGPAPCEIASPMNKFNNSGVFRDCDNGDGVCDINQNNQGIYGWQGPNDTRFEREIVLDDVVGGPNEIPLTVTVKWDYRGKQYTYILEETLFNWSGGN